MSYDRQKKGQLGEQRALDFLRAKGLRLLHRNYRCRVGELDLVMQDRELLVLVEVRYRKHAGFGGGALSVDARKQLRLARAAHMYCIREAVAPDVSCRFDVVALGPRPESVEWFVDAFEVEA